MRARSLSITDKNHIISIPSYFTTTDWRFWFESHCPSIPTQRTRRNRTSIGAVRESFTPGLSTCPRASLHHGFPARLHLAVHCLSSGYLVIADTDLCRLCCGAKYSQVGVHPLLPYPLMALEGFPVPFLSIQRLMSRCYIFRHLAYISLILISLSW